MRVITNPGSNLSPEMLAHYDIVLTPQRIVVDATSYDTRKPIELDEVDRWVESAAEHPYVVGTTAAEFASTFRGFAQRAEPVIAVMTSRKVIKSFDAAESAVRAVRQMPGCENLDAAVVDSGVTDIGAGLASIMAAEAARAGLSTREIAQVIDVFREHARFVFTVDTLDYLVKGGRATPLRAWLANLLNVRPVIAFVSGELSPVRKIKASADRPEALAAWLEGEVPEGERVWAGVFHGKEPLQARMLLQEINKRWDVEWSCIRPLSPSIYLHGGPGCLGVTVVPLSKLPWQPPRPPALE